MSKINVGDCINNYEVLKKWSKVEGKNYFYLCSVKCLTCGHIKTIRQETISTTGCKQGPCHSNFEDFSGERFGQLTAEQYVLVHPDKKTDRWRWKCNCSCGEVLFIPTKCLNRGQTKCKKCADKEAGLRRFLPNSGSAKNRLFRNYQKNAKDRNLVWELSMNEMLSITDKACSYCGNEPVEDSSGLPRNGIDRVDNSIGYSLSNCVPCCFFCNQAKLAHSLNDFYNWIKQTYNHLHQKGTFND
jgi:hypothetical protein